MGHPVSGFEHKILQVDSSGRKQGCVDFDLDVPSILPSFSNLSAKLSSAQAKYDTQLSTWWVTLYSCSTNDDQVVRCYQKIFAEFFHTERSHVRKLKVLERLFYRPLLDEERSHMPREMVERLFPNLEEVSEESPVTDEFLKLGDFLVVVQLIRRPTMPKQKK